MNLEFSSKLQVKLFSKELDNLAQHQMQICIEIAKVM